MACRLRILFNKSSANKLAKPYDSSPSQALKTATAFKTQPTHHFAWVSSPFGISGPETFNSRADWSN